MERAQDGPAVRRSEQQANCRNFASHKFSRTKIQHEHGKVPCQLISSPISSASGAFSPIGAKLQDDIEGLKESVLAKSFLIESSNTIPKKIRSFGLRRALGYGWTRYYRQDCANSP